MNALLMVLMMIMLVVMMMMMMINLLCFFAHRVESDGDPHMYKCNKSSIDF